MKKAMGIILFCCIISLYGSSVEYEEDNTFAFYHRLSLQEQINTILTIQDVCTWFNNQNATMVMSLTQKNKEYVFTYTFELDDPLAQIDLYYAKDICTNLVLKTYINGSRYTSEFYNKEAKKVLLMFLNYNDGFDYHSK